MKHKRISMLLIVALALFVVTGSLPPWQGTVASAAEDDSGGLVGAKIPLSRNMVTSISGYGDPTKLVDEQALVGNPRDGAKVTPYSYWFGDWNMAGNNYPIYAYIDLGQEYDITDIYFYDLELVDTWDDENGAVSFAFGHPDSAPGANDAAWTPAINHNLQETNTWIGNNFEAPARTRYIRVGVTLLGALVPEIVVYGVPVPAKIPLSPAMVTNETGYGNATLLVNEQELAGDPLNGEGGAPSKFWFGDWNSLGNNYPIYAYIDLGREYNLSHIFLHDFNDPGTWDDVNNAHFKVSAGSPSTSWTELFDHTFANPHTNTWLKFDTNVRTRYIRVEANLLAAIISEIVLYGAPAEAKLPDKIALNTSMITAESGGTEAWKLVDEQAAVGNPLTATTAPTATSTWVQTIPARATIDLGQFYDLANIAIRDGEGAGTVNFYTGSSDNWTKMFSDGLKNYNAWTFHPVTTRTRYVQVEYTNTAKMNEIVLYGTPVPTPIQLSTEMVVNESNKGDAKLLVDEQSAAGDPLTNPIGAPTSTWIPSWTEGEYPLSAYIDLGVEFKVTNIALRDVGSIGNATIYAGHPASGSDPASWTQLFVDGMKNLNLWNMHPVNVTTRYVRVQLASSSARVGEIVIYGTPLSGSLPDTRAPGQVTNLTATKPTTTSIRLSWKAPGDDGAAGKADSYDIRYHTSEITIDNWEEATKVVTPPAPLGGGTTQKFVVDGLDADTLYYFALIAEDEAGNVSPLSNVASARTEPLDVTNPTTVTDLSVTFVSGNAARLTWTAPGDDVAGEGRVTSYEVRYSTEAITAGNFNSATAASFAPVPKVAGFEQSVWLYGLNPETTYSIALIAKDEANNASDLSNVATATTIAAATTTKIVLDGSMVLNEAVEGNAKLLVDEQSLAGDPKSASGGTPITAWNVGTSPVYLPASAVIDLGAEYELSDIYLYDGVGSLSVTMFAGNPFDWQQLFVDGLTNDGTWRAHPVQVTTRYLRLLIPAQAEIPEIVVYGALKGVPATAPQPVAHPLPKMDEFIGMNAFIDDPRDVLEAVGFIREYHSWNWDEGDIYPFGVINTDPSRYPGYPNNANRWYNSWAGGGSWNFDNYYSDLKSRGLTVSPVAGGGSVGWLTAAQSNKPIAEDGDPSLPASYIEHADHMYQYAARYGSTEVADDKLKLAATEPRLTGLDYLTYFENWNEPDRWWEGRISHFTPYELSAMTSADYDGHMGTMGDTVGVKNADPNAKLVMSGLAKPDVEYVRAMKFWADYNRDGDLPFDVINIHHYSNNGTNQSNGTVGISPEADRLKERMQEFVEYRDQYMPGVEVWLTEFGYDTHPNSPQKAPAIGDTSQEEVQGQWLIRSYLAIAAAGIDKAAMYMVRDVDINSSTKFDTSGLTRGKNQGWSKKPSWYYVYTMKNVLTGYHFDSEVDSGNENVLIYKFVSDTTDKPVYAVWAPTANNTIVEDYSLDLGDSAIGAKLIELAEGTTDGNRSSLYVVDGMATFDVSERPVFVLETDELPNQSPVITSPANGTTISKVAGENVTITVTATDAEEDTITYSVSGEPNGANATLNASTGVYVWTAPAVGTHTLTFTANDGNGGTASVTVTITVTEVVIPNQAPVITSPVDGSTINKVAGENVSITVTATDADDDTIVYSVTGEPEGANATIDESTGEYVWTAPPVGTYTLTFTASDGNGGTDSVTVTITVTEVVIPNQAPVITSPVDGSTINKVAGEDVSINVTATDADNDTITYSVYGEPDGANSTMDENTGEYVWTAPPEGSHTLTFTASDGNGGTASVTVTITVTEVVIPNQAPVITSPVDGSTINKVAGENVTITVSATDADNDTITYSVYGEPDGANSTMDEDTGEYVWTAPPEGSHTLTFTASDGNGTDLVTVTIMVIGISIPNQAPVITSPANGTTINKVAGEDVSINVTATDADEDTITYSVYGEPDGANATLDADTGVYVWTAPAVGTHTLTFTANDGNGGTASVTVTITVTEEPSEPQVNHAPVITSPANGTTISKIAGENVSITVIATDADNDTITYSVSGEPNGANATLNASTGEYVWTAPPIGTHTLTFTANDGNGGTASVTVTITVTAAATTNNDPGPTVTQSGNQPVIKDGAVEVSAKPDQQGQVNAQLTVDDVKKAAAGAKGKLEITVKPDSTGTTSNIVNVSLPAIALAGDDLALAIDTGLGTVTISASELNRIVGSSTDTLKLTVEKVDTSKLSESARQQVGNHPVVDLTLTLGGTKVSQFNGDKAVQVQIPYSLQPGEDAHSIVVYYIADDGTLTVVKNGHYDANTGTVSFWTDHFSHYAIAHNSVAFNDLAGATWAQESIAALSARGIVRGKGEGKFDPQGNVTRAEFLVMLVGALDLKVAANGAGNAFTDVEQGRWYSDAIAIAASLGIAKGRGDGTFGVNDRITRQEMAILLQRAMQIPRAADAASFNDVGNLSAESQNAIASAATAGLLEGYADGSFKPGAHATRAQAATVIYRALNK